MALAVSQDTTIRVVIGAGGGGGARPFELWSGLKEGVDGSDGSATQLIVDGSVVAEAAGGQANGMGGPKSFSGEVVALAGHDGDAAGPGGAAVAGSITPMATMGGNGGPGPTGTCVLNPLAGVQCDVLSNAGSAGLPGYALISWDIQPGGGP
jgi:hypothetical protein